jgi:outer membrane protein TolC
MNKHLKVFCFLITTTLFTNNLHAQETFINNVNMAYLDKLVAIAKKNYPEVKVKQSQVAAAHSNYNATNPSITSAARETYKVAQYQQAEYMLSLEAQVRKLYFTYLEAMTELRLRTGAVTDANSAVKQLKYAFQKGETTFQIYNEQLNSYYNQNSFMVQAELATWTAKTNLEELLGIKLEDVK